MNANQLTKIPVEKLSDTLQFLIAENEIPLSDAFKQVIDDVAAVCKKLLRDESAPAQPVIPEQSELRYDIHRDANRYRFLRDKDSFGDEGAPGLASWDDLAELDTGEFDSAVDARILSFEVPQYILTKTQEIAATAGVYAELYRLREEVKGPDGFDTWKDAAISEKKKRIEFERRAIEINYLTAMSAFHSDKWHKMDPITGYMHGWNACRDEMLKAQQNEPQNIPENIPAQPVIPEEKSAIHGTKDPEDIAFNNGFVAGWNCCRSEVISLNETTAQPVSEPYKLPVIGWIRSDYDSDRRMGDAPIFILGQNNPSSTWGVGYIPLTGNSPVIQDGWKLVPIEPTREMLCAARDWSIKKNGIGVGNDQATGCYQAMLAAAPAQEQK